MRPTAIASMTGTGRRIPAPVGAATGQPGPRWPAPPHEAAAPHRTTRRPLGNARGAARPDLSREENHMRRMATALISLWWTGLLLVGLPIALIKLAGWPLPDHRPDRHTVE